MTEAGLEGVEAVGDWPPKRVRARRRGVGFWGGGPRRLFAQAGYVERFMEQLLQQLRNGMHAVLAHQLASVNFNGSVADAKAFAYFFGGIALAKQQSDIAFAWGQVRVLLRHLREVVHAADQQAMHVVKAQVLHVDLAQESGITRSSVAATRQQVASVFANTRYRFQYHRIEIVKLVIGGKQHAKTFPDQRVRSDAEHGAECAVGGNDGLLAQDQHADWRALKGDSKINADRCPVNKVALPVVFDVHGPSPAGRLVNDFPEAWSLEMTIATIYSVLDGDCPDLDDFFMA